MYIFLIKSSEAATGGVKRKLLLQIPQNLQENIHVRASFLVMLQASAWTSIKDSFAGVFL